MKIHFIWMQGIEHAPEATQKRLEKNSAKWKSWGHDVFLWSDADVQSLITNGYPSYKAFYNSVLNGIQRCDIARAFILHAYGGLYTDIDYDPHVPLPPMDLSRVVIGGDARMGANNAWIYSPQQDKFWTLHYLPLVQKQLLTPDLLDTFISLLFPTWAVISSTGPRTYWRLREHLRMEPNVFDQLGSHGIGSTPTWFNKFACTQQTLLMILILLFAVQGILKLWI
jgi:mannosyltransferase OCH1-like enzyme